MSVCESAGSSYSGGGASAGQLECISAKTLFDCLGGPGDNPPECVKLPKDLDGTFIYGITFRLSE
jgi:hypothetical protein